MTTIVTVPVEPFQERYRHLIDQGATAVEIAARCDWIRPSDGRPDTDRLKQRLGFKATRKDIGVNKAVTYDTAVALCRGLEVDPVDMGI